MYFCILQVGSAISMTYISGQPIVFVGTGQTYPDLKSLDAKAVVAALMKWEDIAAYVQMFNYCLSMKYFIFCWPDSNNMEDAFI